MRQRRDARPLSRPGAACAGLLGGRSGAGEDVGSASSLSDKSYPGRLEADPAATALFRPLHLHSSTPCARIAPDIEFRRGLLSLSGPEAACGIRAGTCGALAAG